MKKIIGIVIIIVIIVSAVKLFKTRQASLAEATPPPPPTLTLSLVEARQGEVTKSETFLAKLESQREIKITTKLSGYIKKIAISQSQYVEKGDLLVHIDEEELLTSIKSLRVTKNSSKMTTTSHIKSIKEISNSNEQEHCPKRSSMPPSSHSKGNSRKSSTQKRR